MESYEDYMRNRGMHGDGEFIFVQTNEGVERNGYDNGDNDETNNEVIIISDDDSADDDGDDGDDREEEERSAFDIYRQTMGVLSERSTLKFQIFSNLFASSLISDTMSSTVAPVTAATLTIKIAIQIVVVLLLVACWLPVHVLSIIGLNLH